MKESIRCSFLASLRPARPPRKGVLAKLAGYGVERDGASYRVIRRHYTDCGPQRTVEAEGLSEQAAERRARELNGEVP